MRLPILPYDVFSYRVYLLDCIIKVGDFRSTLLAHIPCIFCTRSACRCSVSWRTFTPRRTLPRVPDLGSQMEPKKQSKRPAWLVIINFSVVYFSFSFSFFAAGFLSPKDKDEGEDKTTTTTKSKLIASDTASFFFFWYFVRYFCWYSTIHKVRRCGRCCRINLSYSHCCRDIDLTSSLSLSLSFSYSSCSHAS